MASNSQEPSAAALAQLDPSTRGAGSTNQNPDSDSTTPITGDLTNPGSTGGASDKSGVSRIVSRGFEEGWKGFLLTRLGGWWWLSGW